MDTVYIETTVVGNIAGRIHPDARIAARQNITREWWLTAASKYRLLASMLVISECSDGDLSAAQERLKVMDGIELLASSENVDFLARALIDNRAVPATESRDAFHIAIAAVHGVQYIATWNFKHILNPSCRGRLRSYAANAASSRRSFARPNNFWRLKMIPDPTDEIKEIRRKLAAEFDNDVARIGADIRRQQRESGRKFITLPKREPVLAHAADNK